MRGKSLEVQRIKTLINNDRFKTSDVFLELLQKDIVKVFNDYFDCRARPEIVIIKDKGGYELDIKVKVDRIKTFGVT